MVNVSIKENMASWKQCIW